MTAAAALLFCAALLAILCLTPLDLSFQAEKNDAFFSDIRATWLFGLVKKRFRFGRKTGKASSSEPGGRIPKKAPPGGDTGSRRQKSGKGRRRAVLAAMRTPGFPARLVRFTGYLIRSALPRHMSVRFRGGFQDPAETGMAIAAAAAFSPALCRIPRLEFAWDPDFELHEWKGHAGARFRFVPGRLIWMCVRFVCHPVTVRALVSAHRESRA
jgi:hypothetical protein